MFKKIWLPGVIVCFEMLLTYQTFYGMTTPSPTPVNQTDSGFNRVLYGLFILTSLALLLLSKDYLQTVSTFGIALIFDPFSKSGAWPQRPLWQKVWLIVHVVVLFAGFFWSISQ